MLTESVSDHVNWKAVSRAVGGKPGRAIAGGIEASRSPAQERSISHGDTVIKRHHITNAEVVAIREGLHSAGAIANWYRVRWSAIAAIPCMLFAVQIDRIGVPLDIAIVAPSITYPVCWNAMSKAVVDFAG